MTEKIAAYIGLAQRAGCVLYGEDMIVERKSKVKLTLIDAAAPEKYQKRLMTRLAQCNVYIIEGLDDALHRAGVYAVGITNGDLAGAISGLVRE